MLLIKAPLADIKEDEHVPEGEYDVRIQKATDKESKGGNNMTECLVVIESTEHPNALPMFIYFNYPAEDHTHFDFMWRQNIRMLSAFKVPFEKDGFNSDDLEGATATVFLKVVPAMDSDGVDIDGEFRNEPVFPRLSNEE